MRRIVVLLVITSTFFAAPLLAQGATKDERKFDKSGTMSVDERKGEPITFLFDVPYAKSDNPRHRLDVYLPKGRVTEELPVIVFIHGGGWVHGDKSDGAGRLMPFLRSGQYAGVSIGYRLSGEAQWPAQIYDSKAAIRWVRANAAKYGFDADHIGVLGRSAGAHLALMLGVSDDVPELEGDIGPYRGVSSKVQGVANFFGVSEIMAIIGQPSDIDRTQANAPEAMLIGGPLREYTDKAKAASPITYITPNDAPVLTIHGTEDRTVPYDQAVRIDAVLRNTGVPSYFVIVKGAGHGNFNTAADVRVKAFFDKYLRENIVPVSTATIENWKP